MALSHPTCVLYRLLKQIAMPLKCTLYTTCERIAKESRPAHIKICKRYLSISPSLMGKAKPDIIHSLNEVHSSEDTEKILQLLNDSAEPELKSKGVPLGLLNHVVKLRPFHQIEDLLDLPRMSPLAVRKLCKKLLKEQDFTGRLLYPSLDPAIVSKIKRITALRAQETTYVTLNANGSYIAAGYVLMGKTGKRVHIFRYDHITYIQEMKRLIEDLPQSDAYIFPQQQMFGNSSRANLQIKYGRLLLENTFSSLLSTNNSQEHQICTYYMPEMRVCSAFDVLVGGEKVGCMNKLEQVLEGKYENYQPQNIGAFKHQLSRVRLEHTKDQIGFLFLQCLLFIADDLKPLLAK